MKYFSLFTGLWLLGSTMAFAGEPMVYFGTFTGAKTKSQGIYVARLDLVTGKLSAPELAVKIKNPHFLALSPDQRFIYSVGETTNSAGKTIGTVRAFSIDAQTGTLTLLNQQISGGTGAGHVAVDATGKCLLVANYASGSIAALPIHPDGSLGEAATVIQHSGSSVNPIRQAGPHAHFIQPSPDNRFALNCDLGLDKVFVYRLDAAAARLVPDDPPFATLAPGSGPRHLVFSPNGKFVYVINEMGGSISAFSYDPSRGALTPVQTISTLPKDFLGGNTSAEIVMHPTGKFLYGSNRGADSIAVFAVDPKSGRLTLVEHQSTEGRTPRHIALDPTGHWLLAENQASNSVIVFAVDQNTGKLRPTGQSVTVGSPVCAVFVGNK